MDRQAQDQLDESAGQELVARLQELSSPNEKCRSCGALLGSLQHFMACGAAAPLVQPQIRIDPNCNGTIFCHSAYPAESTPRSRYIARFKAYTAKMLEITTKKNNDYGGAESPFKNFSAYGSLGILVRMSDKMARLHTAIAEKRKFEVDESLEDTALDLANYAVLLLCYMQSEERQ